MSDIDRGRDPGRALRCEESRVLLMGYIDGELDGAARARLEDHLSVCVACRAEEQAYRRLGRVTEAVLSEEVVGRLAGPDPWPSVYRRLERGIGWLLFGLGLVLLGGYGLWQFLSDFLLDPEVPVAVRAGVSAVSIGVLVLLASVARDTLKSYRSERYREVQR
jgi:anti-sigma factor RsiW